MPYDGYRITVDKLTPNGHTMRRVEIVLTSDYTLIEDLSEWVKVEIDADASIEITELDPTCDSPEHLAKGPGFCTVECLKSSDGKHVQRAGWQAGKTVEFCNECGVILRTIDTP